jgi:hypothetical protein
MKIPRRPYYTNLKIEQVKNPLVSIVPFDTDDPISGIEINDSEGRDLLKPRITILYRDGAKKSIDILDSVKNNAASMGHPAIIYAIKRWEEIIRIYHHQASRRHDKIYDIAAKHLRGIGSALLEGAKERAVSKEVMFGREILELPSIHQAWTLLGTDTIKKIRNKEIKLSTL